MKIKIKSEIVSEMYKFTREFFITILILYGIFKCINWEIPILYLFTASFFMSIITWAANDNRMKKIFFIIPAIFVVIIVMILILFFHINIFLFLQRAFFWNYEYIRRIGEFNLYYSMVTVCILFVIIMQIIIRVEKNIVSKFITAMGLLVLMVICAINNIQWNAILTGIMLFCCFDIIVEAYQVKVGGTARYAEACLTPFITITVFLSICLPSDKEPIRWSWVAYTVNSIRDNVQEFVYNLEQRGNEARNEFDVNKAGFSEEGTNSFGKLIDDKERNMFFLSIKSSMKIGYLDGVILSTYTGSQWKKNENDYDNYTEDYKMDLYEKLYNLYHTDLKQSPDEDFARNVDYEIKFDKLVTKTVFRPENCYFIETNNEKIDFDAIGNNIYFSNKQEKGYSYGVSSVIMNMNNEDLKQYLRGLNQNSDYYKEKQDGKGDFEGSLFKQAIIPFKFNENEFKYITSDDLRQRLYERSRKIKQEYLQIPNGTPERVRKLAEEITKDYTNPYDKAEAICKYLRDNFDYTTKINQLPEGKDAVDYFLFEQKKGYCIYFASAMAVMCRYLDIPTRYVEGVTLDYRDNDEEWYKVKTKAAHAWTEVYLEGFGWIRMDPTPGYYDAASWTINSEGWQRYVNQGSKRSSEKVKISVQQNEEKPVEENPLGTIVLWLKYLFIVLAFSAVLVLLGIGAFILNKRRIYRKASNREKAFICMKKILSNLEKQGYELEQGETLKEFKEKLEKDKTFDNFEILKLLEWFQGVRYSNKIVTKEEIAWVEQFLVVNKRQN